MPFTSATGILGRKRAAHLLRRATGQASIAIVDSFSTLTAQEAVSQLFQQSTPPPMLPLDPVTGEEWFLSGSSGGSESFDLIQFFIGWFTNEVLATHVPIEYKPAYQTRERLVLFLHTHFTTQRQKVGNSRSLYFQNELFRRYALNNPEDENINFEQLCVKICVDNAMLKFLDGSQNVKGSPNENYAREFMELYTIGRGLEGALPPASEEGDYINYKEQDVQEAARILSGFKVDTSFTTIDEDTLLPRGRLSAGSHDSGTKTFSNRFQGTVISPDPALMLNGATTEESAIDEIRQLVRLIFSQDETARYISRKVYRFYVYHTITEEIENTIIADMATIFRDSRFKLQTLLETLFTSQEFYEATSGVDDDKFGAIIKSPLELITSTYGLFDIKVPVAEEDIDGYYSHLAGLMSQMGRQGLDFYEPFEVAGYPAYHQYPHYNRNWITPNYLTSRYDFVRNVLGDMDNPIDLIDFISNHFPNATAQNAKDLIIALAEYLFPMASNLTFDTNAPGDAQITPERMNYFLRAFLYTPQIDADPEGSWTFRWNNRVDDEVLTNQLTNLLNAMLQSPEYQLF